MKKKLSILIYRRLIRVSLALLVSLIGSTVTLAASTQKPNLIVIVVDDQRWDEFSAAGHPFIDTPNMDRLANEGVRFTSAYSTTPLCSPNRASILTGQYASRHGIIDNIARDLASHRLNLFAADLRRAGYETAHIGKWHMGNDPTPRPGYDYWVSFPGQGRSTNPELFEEGRLHQVHGYLTDILTERAVNFIRKKRERPFFLYIGHKAVHPDLTQREDSSVDDPLNYVPAPRHIGRYKDAVFPWRKNYRQTPDQLTGKPVLQEALLMKREMKFDFPADEKTIRDRSEMLLAVDEGLGQIIQELERQDILDDTAILFTSDNGFFYGEHDLSVERRMPYEEGVRVPLLFRYPKLAKKGQVIDNFILSIDIAPTMLDLAGVEIGKHIQGESFVRLLAKKRENAPTVPWRNSFLMEYVSYEKPMPWLVNTTYKVVRMEQYKYIHWVNYKDKDELYDLNSDPYELNNRIADEKLTSVVIQLKQELSRLVSAAYGLE